MAMRGTAMAPSTAARSLICVDSIISADIAGTIHNPYMPGPVTFVSSYDMIRSLENFFDRIAFPQSSYENRTFTEKTEKTIRPQKQTASEVRRYMSDDIFSAEQGKKATFVVQVQFRQNATWQGTITWTDEKKTQRFRSTLEMLKLMDSALKIDGSESDNAEWQD